MVVTGRSTVQGKPYRIIELTPHESRVNLGLLHAFAFNTRYTLATFRALKQERFDVVHHVLPFAVGRTYNLATLRCGRTTPFVIGPVQPPIAVLDWDVDARDLSGGGVDGQTAIGSLTRAIAQHAAAIASGVIPPVAFSPLSRRTVVRAAAVVAVNEDAKALLLRSGVSPSRVVIIPPGVDTQRFAPATRRDRSGGVQLLSVCHLVKRKNVDTVIRAFAMVAQVAPQATLRIVGDGPQRAALMTLAAALGIGERVIFAGSVPNAKVHEEYRGSDVFVNASAAEGFATVCLEALASGLPIISTRVGGFVDAVEDHRNGYLLHGGDAEELAAALKEIVGNRALIREFSERARNRAEQEFDWDAAVLPRYLKVYDRVAGERHVRASRRMRRQPRK